jgi:phosphoglycerate dehydrogenase-like enzyme
MLNQWLSLKQQGKSLEQYFIDNGYKSIAIYGVGEMGARLCEELKGTSIEVKYGIDKNASSTYSELEVKDAAEYVYEKVDVIVVTAIFAFDEIYGVMESKVDCPILSLEDIVFGV